MILYAIYKNGVHKGNQRGSTKLDAIQKYIIESQLEEFLSDVTFIKMYSATIAKKGFHFEELVAIVD
jgi:hypothetical protein